MIQKRKKKLDILKIKNICSSKDSNKKMQRQAMD